MSDPTRKDEEEAIRRIGASRDGYMLRRFLQRELNSIAPLSENLSALPRHEGRRSFAHELRALLDQDAPSAGTERDRAGSQSDPDEPFAVARAYPVAVTRPGTRRRVEPYPVGDHKA